MPSNLITVPTPFGPRRLLPLDRISPPDPRDFRFRPSAAAQTDAHYDLCAAGLMPPIRDQGQEGSCAGHASSEYLGHLYRRAGKGTPIFSPAFPYYEGRALEGWQNQDSGAYLRDEFKVLQTLGCCVEEEMPYVAGQYAQAPSAQALTEALGHLIDAYAQTALADLDAALAQNMAVAVGSYWYNEWFSGGDPQYHIIPDVTSQPVGAHAWLICGAQTSLNVNTGKVERLYRHHGSWGTVFGDAGHVWFPQHIVQTAVYEYWTAQKAFAAQTTLDLLSTESAAAAGEYVLTHAQPSPNLLSAIEQEFVALAGLLTRGGSDIKKLLGL